MRAIIGFVFVSQEGIEKKHSFSIPASKAWLKVSEGAIRAKAHTLSRIYCMFISKRFKENCYIEIVETKEGHQPEPLRMILCD